MQKAPQYFAFFLFFLFIIDFYNPLLAQPRKADPSTLSLPSPTTIPSPDPLPLRRVVLYTSGVAFFEREAQVTGSGSIDLYFRTEEINDMLKSLVIQDPAREIPPFVSYASRDPIDRMLRSFSLDLSANPSLPSLLLQARGEEVEIWAGERFAGRILGVENRSVSTAGGGITEELFINLFNEQGFKSIPYRQITSFQFRNPVIQSEVSQALQYLAENINTEKRKLTLTYSGSGTRSLRVSYVLESPIWKATFRLLLTQGQRHTLQGWAIVENATDKDWNQVRLELISGRPISFSMNLFEPIYNPRPEVPYTVERQLPPPIYYSGIPHTKEQVAAREELVEKSFAAPLAAPSILDGQAETLGTLAGAAATGEFVRYTIQEPVRILRRQAALIPILNTPIEGERLSLYNESINRRHPLLSIWLRNTTDLALMGGPLTVYEDGQYAGDARIDTISVGDKRLLSYAVDLDTEVFQLDRTEPERITQIRIRRGTLLVSKSVRKERTYTLVNRGPNPRIVLIEHPATSGFKLVEPQRYEERTETVYRFRVNLPPRTSSGIELKVTEEKPIETTAALSNVPMDEFLFYLNQRVLSPKMRDALSKVISLQSELADAVRIRQQVETRIQQITLDQERIRENMGVLDKTTPLYQRFLETLNEQEDTFEELQKALEQAESLELAKRRALDNYLSTLDVD